jgi:hypothetical protein
VAARCAFAVRPPTGATAVIHGTYGTQCSVPVTRLLPGTEYAYTPLANSVPLRVE